MGELVLRQEEGELDRLDLGDGDQGRGAGHGDHIAGLNLDGAGLAVDGRGDAGIAQIDLGIVDVALVRLNHAFVGPHRGSFIIDRLLGDSVGRHQRLIARQIGAGAGERRLILGKLALGLGESGLERCGIDQEERIALMDQLAFLKIGYEQLTLHLGGDLKHVG